MILGKPSQWFNPKAFLRLPVQSSKFPDGFYGNLGRDTLIGPGLANGDFSAIKQTYIGARMNLQFRAEIFNLLNRANFNTPNLGSYRLPKKADGDFADHNQNIVETGEKPQMKKSVVTTTRALL